MRKGMPVRRESSRRAARASGAAELAAGMSSATPLVMRSSCSETGGKDVVSGVMLASQSIEALRMPDRKHKAEKQAGEQEAKTCAACGRTMEWRKAWAKNWEAVKFCSERCRQGRVSV